MMTSTFLTPMTFLDFISICFIGAIFNIVFMFHMEHKKQSTGDPNQLYLVTQIVASCTMLACISIGIVASLFLWYKNH